MTVLVKLIPLIHTYGRTRFVRLSGPSNLRLMKRKWEETALSKWNVEDVTDFLESCDVLPAETSKASAASDTTP